MPGRWRGAHSPRFPCAAAAQTRPTVSQITMGYMLRAGPRGPAPAIDWKDDHSRKAGRTKPPEIISAPGDGVVDHQYEDRADDGNQEAVDVEGGDGAADTEGLDDETADHGTDNAEHDIKQQAGARLVDN